MVDQPAGEANSPANLLYLLCRRILKKDDVSDQFNHVLRIIGSHFEPSIATDEFQLTEKIKRRLATQNRLSDAALFSELYNKLSSKSVLQNQWAILYLLHSISQTSNRSQAVSFQGSALDSFFGGSVSSRATSTPAQPPFHSMRPGNTPGPTPGGISTIHSGTSSSGISSLSSGQYSADPTPTPSSFVPNVRSTPAVRFTDERATPAPYSDGSRLASLVANSLAIQSRQGSRTGADTVVPSSLMEQYKSYRSGADNTSYEVSEALLLRDIIYIFQGIDGNLIKLDQTSDTYCIKSDAGVPQSVRDLVNKLAELGWMYRRVRKYLDARTGDKALGLVGQSFCAALQDELTEYYRLVAVLEAQQQISDQGISPEGASGSLTLRRLAVWTYDPMLRLKILAALVDVCKGKKGGALLSAIHSFMQHGDPFVKSLVKHILNQVARPIKIIMDKWIYEGELEDSFHEFFVAADYTVKDERLWYEKYSLRKSMIPSFISQELATKILNIGKSINFIHQVCQDHYTPSKSLMRTRTQSMEADNEVSTDDNFGAAALQPVVDAAYKETSKYLLETLIKKYKFIEHLNAMRRYLLLGQGDFIRHLMDLLESDLAKNASTLYMHNLTGVLETAIRATNAQFEDPEILRRLDCRLFEVSPGDTGWDVFSLDYHVDGPISTVFTPECMIYYLRIFNFLWRAKRMEYILTGIWKIQTTNYRLLKGIPELAPILHQSHMLASEMIHFIHQMQYYIMFEVLECCWAELLKKVQEATDLDHVIAAHETFLDKVLSSSLLDTASRAMLGQLRTIFDLIIKYQGAQENLFKAATDEMEYRRRCQSNITKRTVEGNWGLTEDEEEEQRRRSENFIQNVIPSAKAQLRVLAQSYQDMVQEFLVMLTSQSDVSLRFLSFRLDFNENYKKKEPKLRRSLTARYSKYIRKAKETATIPSSGSAPAAAT